MRVSYDRLWSKLVDLQLMKKDLARLARISSYTVSKMANDQNVTVDVLGKICCALNCGPEEIVEFFPERGGKGVSIDA